MKVRWLKGTVLGCFVICFSSCLDRPTRQVIRPIPCLPLITDTNPNAVTTDWEKKHWISKAARKLLGGADLDPSTRSAWTGKSREEIVRTLLSDSRFGETVLDFNLYFLGFKRDSLKDPSGMLAPGLYDFPQAINSAKNVLECGDYFSLFELRQPIYIFPPTPASSSEPNPLKPPPDELRAQFVDGLNYYIEKIEGHEDANLAELCNHYTQSAPHLGNLLFSMGLPSNLPFSTAQWLVDLRNSCDDPGANLKSFSATLRRVTASFHDLMITIESVDPESGLDLSTVTPIATSAFGDDGKTIQFTSRIRQNLTNSSTNYNRKRAAYILDRFFCDDLTPINVENLAEHVGDRHASDPSCFACHYRLDPMAGFFKDYGIAFSSFKDASSIIFDDMAIMEKAKYDRAWFAPGDSGREWDIGYVRSLNQGSLNTYGTDLDDLFRIIKAAPEVKRCVVKRMYEYFIGEEQTIDAGYLDYLTQEFLKASAQNSSQAFQELAAKMVLSRAFLEHDLESGVCYDFAPGRVADESPPCRVNYLLESNCVSCHGKQQQEGRLDLSRWVRAFDGRMTFPHTTSGGRPLSREATLSADLGPLEPFGSRETNAARSPHEPTGTTGAFHLGQ